MEKGSSTGEESRVGRGEGESVRLRRDRRPRTKLYANHPVNPGAHNPGRR